jgi:hypothetical protein
VDDCHDNKTERISPMQNDGDNKDNFRFRTPFSTSSTLNFSSSSFPPAQRTKQAA